MTNETRDKMLLMARDRLRNRPGEYRRFQAALETIEGTRMMTLAGALPVVTRQAADFGIQRAVEAERAHLLKIVDDWAESQPVQPAVEPLATPGAAMHLPLLGAETGESAPAKTTSRKTEKTLIFEAKVQELLSRFWNERTPGTEPTKNELCKLVYQEILRTNVRGARKTTLSMVIDAAKPWKLPLVLPTYVRDSQFNEKRHPFKGEK